MATEQTDNTEQDNSLIRELRSKIEELSQQNSTLLPAARKATFLEAGLDTSNPFSALFMDKYDGDLSVEAVKEAAGQYPGLLKGGDTGSSGPASEEEEDIPEAEAAAHQRVASAGTAATAPSGTKPAWEGAKSVAEFLAAYDGQVLTD